jgi:hypothetical protein
MDVRTRRGKKFGDPGVLQFRAYSQGAPPFIVQGVHIGPQGYEEPRKVGVLFFRRNMQGRSPPGINGVHIHLAQKIGPCLAGFPVFQEGPDIVFSGNFCLRAAFASPKGQGTYTGYTKNDRFDKKCTLHIPIIGRKRGAYYREFFFEKRKFRQKALPRAIGTGPYIKTAQDGRYGESYSKICFNTPAYRAEAHS